MRRLHTNDELRKVFANRDRNVTQIKRSMMDTVLLILVVAGALSYTICTLITEF